MRILLHVCCAVCSAGVAEELKGPGHSVTGFFYNPNIYPEGEYAKRLQAARDAAGRAGFELAEGEYNCGEWKRLVQGHEKEKEGGARCTLCFKMRLKKTYEHFLKGRFDLFTTTLTISPLKKSEVVNKIGSEIGGKKFMAADFKKGNGFKRTVELAKRWELYRQGYCGCEYSRSV